MPFHLFRNIPGEKGGERMALDTNAVIPAHVALILDGNGGWAKKRGLPRTMGHKEGCVTVEKTVEIAARILYLHFSQQTADFFHYFSRSPLPATGTVR